jgi:hypothetical protein
MSGLIDGKWSMTIVITVVTPLEALLHVHDPSLEAFLEPQDPGFGDVGQPRGHARPVNI